MRALIALLLLALCIGTPAEANTIISMVGDIDGFVPGDLEDTPLRSQDLLDAFSVSGAPSLHNLDEVSFGAVGYTHNFNIPTGHIIVGAILRVGVFPIEGRAANTDYLGLDTNIDSDIIWSTDFGPRATFVDEYAGGSVPPSGTTTEIIIDLAATVTRPSENGPQVMLSLLPELEDGIFNVFVADDSGVDYSILVIETIPEPASVALLALSSLFLMRRR